MNYVHRVYVTLDAMQNFYVSIVMSKKQEWHSPQQDDFVIRKIYIISDISNSVKSRFNIVDLGGCIVSKLKTEEASVSFIRHTINLPLAIEVLSSKYLRLKNLQLNSNKSEYLALIADFAYLFINIMPYRNGSSAIGEWLIRGLVLSKGITLGPFNHAQIAWDFLAMTLPGPTEYQHEFENLFLDELAEHAQGVREKQPPVMTSFSIFSTVVSDDKRPAPSNNNDTTISPLRCVLSVLHNLFK